MKAIREAFGDWKGGVPYVRVTSPYKDVAPATRSIETPDKENAMFLARLNVNMQDTDPDYPALLIANYIMGQSGFDSRLIARIRVKDGLSYGAGSGLSVGATDLLNRSSASSTDARPACRVASACSAEACWTL